MKNKITKHKPAKNVEARKPSEGKQPASVEPTKLAFEGLLAREEAASYFEALIAGVRKGQVRFRRGDQALTLVPAAHIEVEVKAARKEGKEKLSFEMAWSAPTTNDFEID
jgi:amphi-Trp domain-containing protein